MGYKCPKCKKKEIVQIKNPKTGRYVKIDRAAGRIIDHKKTQGPYRNIPEVIYLYVQRQYK
jgi:hypothetical protein